MQWKKALEVISCADFQWPVSDSGRNFGEWETLDNNAYIVLDCRVHSKLCSFSADEERIGTMYSIHDGIYERAWNVLGRYAMGFWITSNGGCLSCEYKQENDY